MAITQTTLSADIDSKALTFAVGSGTGFPAVGTIANPGYPMRINGEYMIAIAQPVAGTIKVRGRGSNGTAAVAHDKLSKVEVSATAADFTQPPPGSDVSLPPFSRGQETIGEDRTFTSAEIAALSRDTDFAVTKGSAAAIVLVAPSKAQDGLRVSFTSLTAWAHVITATTLLGDAVSGSPHTTATFAAFIGTSLTLQAQNGIWNVMSSTGITVT